MKNSYKFFSNSDCKYFPCHNTLESDNFNCIFCYCPLYFMGEKCGGNFIYSGVKQIKNCKDCNLPHNPEYFEIVMSKLKDFH